jgi:hypothetical protein
MTLAFACCLTVSCGNNESEPSSQEDEIETGEEYYQSERSVYQEAPYSAGTNYSSGEFMGYPCTVDCSGHEAGYEWAEEHDIDDPDDCGGNSDSFIEGCQAYAEERQTLMAIEDDTDDDFLLRF